MKVLALARTGHRGESQLYYMGVLHALEHVALPAISHCFRRDAVYYWRRWTPGPKRALLQIGLGVKVPRTARALSSILTARSEELFPLWTDQRMNKTQLLDYLHKCLAEGRRHVPRDSVTELSTGLASRILATRGLRAELTAGDQVAIDRQWGQPGLFDAVASAIDRKRAGPLDLEDFLKRSLAASLAAGKEPDGEDAEQAARVRFLAEASLAFQAARDLSISDMALDKYVADIAAGIGLPEATEVGEPLEAWLERTIRYLSRYNPYEYDDNPDFELKTILDEPPTLLADWVRQGRPSRGSNEPDHAYLERQTAQLRQLLKALPLLREGFSTNAQENADAPLPIVERSAQTGNPVVPPTAPSATIIEAGNELADKLEQDGAWDPNTANQAKSTYAFLAKFLHEEHGVARVADFRQWHLGKFDEFLREIYRYYGQSSRLQVASIAELREVSSKKPREQCGLAVGTRTRHMGAIAQLLEYVRNTEDVDAKLKPSAYRGKKVGRGRNDRIVPGGDKMSQLFHAPVFVGCRNFEELDEPGPHVFHRAAYFGPMLAHYQGMRREEFCGLAVEDIIIDNGELPYIHVCFNHIRRLKNVQSIRNLALHPELVRLGFLDYVEHVRELGFERVFPDLHNTATNAPLGNRFYDELEPIRERLGISPHQIRHFFNNELKQKRVSHEFRADMLGHGGHSETTERYCNSVEIELQREDLAKIELRTAHLQRQPIRLLPWVVAKRQPPPWARPDRTKAMRDKKASPGKT